MFEVNINGKDYRSESDMVLMDFLREELRITSVKNGCKEGACGTCTVIIDGKTSRSCIPKLSKLAGKKILTIEGFSERERDVFAHAFAAAGAVQCGFCIPGQLMAAQALLGENPSPTIPEVQEGLAGNLCRCGCYQQITEAVLAAADAGER